MIESSMLLFSIVGIVSLLLGTAIGVGGVGGVAIIPFLILFAGLDIHTIIPTCMLAYAACAPVAVYSYARKGSIRWDKALYLIIGAAPGAYLGSITVLALPSGMLEAIVAVFVLFSGLQALRKAPPKFGNQGMESVSKYILILLGFFVGYGSSLTGTGGPLLLVPSLLFLNFPILNTVGLSMAIQLPISPFATLGHFIHGTIDWFLSIPIAIGTSAGILVGAAIAHRISANSMRRAVAVILICCSVLIFARVLI